MIDLGTLAVKLKTEGVDTATTALKGFGAISAAAMAGATALVGGVVKLSKETAAAGDNVDKMSQRLGMSREGFQQWDFVLSQSGSDINSFQTGMKTLTKRFDELASGTGVGVEGFKKLGLSYSDLKDKSQEAIFESTIKAFNNMEDGIDKARLAQEMFGKQGQELLPLLNSDADGIEALKQKAIDYGMVMSEDAVNASVAFTDSMDVLGRTTEGLKNKLMAEFLPSITEITDGLSLLFTGDMSGLDDVTKGVEDLTNKIMEIVPKIMEIGLPIIQELAQSIMDNLPQLVQTATDLILGLVDFLLDNIDLLIDCAVQLVVGLTVGLIKALPKLIEAAVKLLKGIITAITQVAGVIGSAIGNFVENNIITPIKNKLSQMVSMGKNLVEGLWNGITNATDWIIDKIKGFTDKVLKKIKSFFGINSPSKKTEEYGKFLVEGLAVGITENMTAEEAIKKKCENVLSIANDLISNNSLDSDLIQSTYELWKSENPLATDTEKQQQFIKNLDDKIQIAEDNIKAYNDALYISINDFGADSDSSKKLQTMLNNAKITKNGLVADKQDYLKSIQPVEDKQEESIFKNFMNYIRKNSFMLQEFGLSSDTLIEGARKATGYKGAVDKEVTIQQNFYTKTATPSEVKTATKKGILAGEVALR